MLFTVSYKDMDLYSHKNISPNIFTSYLRTSIFLSKVPFLKFVCYNRTSYSNAFYMNCYSLSPCKIDSLSLTLSSSAASSTTL